MGVSMSVSDTPLFQTLASADIEHLMNKEIEHVKSIVEFDMPSTTIRVLLSHKKWDTQELLNQLTDEKTRDKLLEAVNVRNPLKEKPALKRSTITCSFCFTDFPQENIVDLGCGHEYCIDCWRQYLTFKISNGQHAESIRCPAPNCGIVVDDDIVLTIVSNENTIQRYKQLMTNSFVEHNNALRWCPAPGCTYVIRATHLVEYLQNCTCASGHTFCFACGDEPHDPIPCKLIKIWKKNENDSTVKYLLEHEKFCPLCTSTVENNGQMLETICKKCDYKFCWQCLGDLQTHDLDECRAKYLNIEDRHNKKLWYGCFGYYDVHKQSLEAELSWAPTQIEKKMRQLQAMGKSRYEVEVLQKIVEVLWNNRKQLMLTYIFAYFVAPHDQKTIFEINQKNLEVATEALSACFVQDFESNDADEIILNFLNKSSYCQNRLKILQDHIFEGLEKDWWTFTE